MKERTLFEINDFFVRYPWLTPQREVVLEIIDTLVTAFRNGNKLLVCGNGGSAADSDHIVGELMKGFKNKRPVAKKLIDSAQKLYGEEGATVFKGLEQGLPAISLTCQTALMTAFLNDCDPQFLYAQQVNALINKGDILIAISTSGNAKNVANAVIAAKVCGGTVIGLTGNTGGRLKNLCDICFISPQKETFKIQEEHLPLYHLLCATIESELFE